MKKHKYGNTETYDLWNAWSQVSGKDIGQVRLSPRPEDLFLSLLAATLYQPWVLFSWGSPRMTRMRARRMLSALGAIVHRCPLERGRPVARLLMHCEQPQ